MTAWSPSPTGERVGMKILQYVEQLRNEIGGVVREVVDLSAALAAAGHEVTLATTDDQDWPGAWPKDSRGTPTPRLWKLGTPAWPMHVFSGEQVREICERLGEFEVLHLHGVWELSNAQMAAAAYSFGVPHIVSLCGMLDDWPMAQASAKKTIHLRLTGRRLLERAAFVHCTAQGELDQSLKWFPHGRGIVIPHILDFSPYRPLPGPELARRTFPRLTNGRPNVLFLSRVNYKKGTDVLIDAVAQMRDRGIDTNLLIAGPKDEDYFVKLQQQIVGKNLGERVEFLGLVSTPLKESLYQASDVFALPTSQENFGFVFYESLACGTPIVTCPTVDTWAELKGSGGAVIVDRDTARFAEVLGDLVSDLPRARAMGQAGREWVMRELDPARVLGQFERLYERAIAPPTRTIAP